MKKWFGLILALFIVLADQISKQLIATTFILGEEKTILPCCFNLVFALNKGAAFGFLNRPDIHWQTYVFLLTTVFASLLIIILLFRGQERQWIYVLGLSSILGGAVGNFIDRARIGYVIDFLDFHIGSYHWPAFNLADTFICIGGTCLVIHFIWLEEKTHASVTDQNRPN